MTAMVNVYSFGFPMSADSIVRCSCGFLPVPPGPCSLMFAVFAVFTAFSAILSPTCHAESACGRWMAPDERRSRLTDSVIQILRFGFFSCLHLPILAFIFGFYLFSDCFGQNLIFSQIHRRFCHAALPSPLFSFLPAVFLLRRQKSPSGAALHCPEGGSSIPWNLA